jgi:hypothetical protein
MPIRYEAFDIVRKFVSLKVCFETLNGDKAVVNKTVFNVIIAKFCYILVNGLSMLFAVDRQPNRNSS